MNEIAGNDYPGGRKSERIGTMFLDRGGPGWSQKRQTRQYDTSGERERARGNSPPQRVDRGLDDALDLEEALEVEYLEAADADDHDGLQDGPELDAVVGRLGRCAAQGLSLYQGVPPGARTAMRGLTVTV